MTTTNTASMASLLEMVSADEQVLLRTGALARELLARHSDLPLNKAGLKEGNEIHLNAPTAEDVRAWAARLDAEVIEHTAEPGYGTFRHTATVTVIDGIKVHVYHCHMLSDTEAAAWRESGGQT